MRAAGDDTPTLPEDPAVLRALLLSAWAERDALATRCDGVAAERDALAVQNDRLQHLLLKLKRRQFGRKSERLPEDQLLFAFEEIEAALAANAAEAGKRSPALRRQQAKRRRAGRGRLPAHLPRVEVVLAPEATACPCCRGPLVEIGADTSERLDVIPARFRVVVTRGTVQKLGVCGRGRYDRPGRCRLGDRGWAWCCGWSRRGLMAGRAASMCWNSADPATYATSPTWA
jgi:transposase